VKLCSSLHQTPLYARQFARDQVNRLNAEDADMFLVVRMKCGA
jgi:hypothetical protein